MKQDCQKGKKTIMGCKKTRSEILLYAEGLLERESSRVIESHLQNCSECRDFLVFIKESLLTIEREKSTDSNPFMATMILNALDTSRHRVRNAGKWVPAFAFAILFVAAVIGGINLGKLYSRTILSNKNELQEEMSYIDDLEQEQIENYFMTSNETGNE